MTSKSIFVAIAATISAYCLTLLMTSPPYKLSMLKAFNLSDAVNMPEEFTE
jgi:hypothetical protein